MADNLSVFTQYNNLKQPVALVSVLSDAANNNIVVIGLPGATYNLNQLNNEVQGTTIVATETSVSPNTNAPGIPLNDLPSSSTREVLTFKDTQGNTLTLLGSPNTVYDLQLLPYLLATVSAIEEFMNMQFGSDYQTIKNQYLQQAGLV